MSNDDLGQFPSPTASSSPDSPAVPTSDPTFEPTPDVIPSVSHFDAPESSTPETKTSPVSHQDGTVRITPISEPVLTPQEIPATVPKGGSSFGSIVLISLLLLAGIGLAASVFLFSKSQQLKNQLIEITQTLEKQKTVITPTPTFTEVEAVTPSITPTPPVVATISATITATPSGTPTPQSSKSDVGIMPLAAAATALRIAINHEPNAQLILIKTEDFTDINTLLTKYYFRQNLTTKKYFYVSLDSKGQSQLVDTAIYVTPDNNIPSLNDMVLGNTLGIDFDQALKIATDLCAGNTCTTASVKAQYIKSGNVVIWQLIFDPQDPSKDNLIIQINAQTKEVLYKSANFK